MIEAVNRDSSELSILGASFTLEPPRLTVMERSGHIRSHRLNSGTTLEEIFDLIRNYTPQAAAELEAPPHPLCRNLTSRQEQIATLVAKGLCNKEIATALRLSDRTVQVHIANAFTRLEVSSRTELAIKFLKAYTPL